MVCEKVPTKHVHTTPVSSCENVLKFTEALNLVSVAKFPGWHAGSVVCYIQPEMIGLPVEKRGSIQIGCPQKRSWAQDESMD